MKWRGQWQKNKDFAVLCR